MDLRTMKVGMLEPDYIWRDDAGAEIGRGRYWRRNHKNRRCVPSWFPMEPEFRALVLGWFEENPRWHADVLVVGPIWVASKVAARAAALAGLEYVSPNLGMRRSFATMLASRGHPNEYIRQALGHEGEAYVDHRGAAPVVRTTRPSMASSHYIRSSADMMRAAVSRR
jgi:integrase